jgi:3',5'-cyclic-AMP phosphodiesterase
MPLRIGIVTDVHFGPDSPSVLGSAAPRLLARSLERLGELEPQLLVDLGDRLTDETPEIDLERLRTLAGLFGAAGVHSEHLRGNHDLLPPTVHQRLLGRSVTNRSHDVRGWHLVFLDSFDGSIEGALTPGTLGWLEADLARNSLPTVVFSHQPLDGEPLIGNPIFEVEYAAHAHPKGHEAARTILASAGSVRLAVNGHAHWNHRVEVDGVPYVTLQSLVARDAAGDPAGAHALLELGETSSFLRVFGAEPFEVRV